MGAWVQNGWKMVGGLWTDHKWWIIGGATIVGGALIVRALPALVGRWGYEKLVTERKTKVKERKRKVQIRHLLRESFRWNLELLKSMEAMMTGKTLTERQIPTFNVDIPILESTAGLIQLEVLDDVNAYKIVDHARYELTHVSRKVNWLINMFIKQPRNLDDLVTTSLDAKDQLFFGLVRSTILLIQSCQEDCRKAIDELDRLEMAEKTSNRKGIFNKKNYDI